jgi:hypothetical protein
MKTATHIMNAAHTTEVASHAIVLCTVCSRERLETPRKGLELGKKMESCGEILFIFPTSDAQ